MPNASMILSDPAIPKLDRLPEGWVRTKVAQTALIGWYWANNGKSLFAESGRAHSLRRTHEQRAFRLRVAAVRA